MPIEPNSLVDYAQSLFGKNMNEVTRRTVVNRAYYGAFLVARDLAGITQKRGVHQKVIDHYLMQSNSIGNQLKTLRNLRNQADYSMNSTIVYQDTDLCCKTAKKVIEHFARVINERAQD